MNFLMEEIGVEEVYSGSGETLDQIIEMRPHDFSPANACLVVIDLDRLSLQELLNMTRPKMVTIESPSEHQFKQIFTNVGGGWIGEDWIKSAYNVVRIWTAGQLWSSPYGPDNTRLSVSWQWNNGEVSVTVQK